MEGISKQPFKNILGIVGKLLLLLGIIFFLLSVYLGPLSSPASPVSVLFSLVIPGFIIFSISQRFYYGKEFLKVNSCKITIAVIIFVLSAFVFFVSFLIVTAQTSSNHGLDALLLAIPLLVFIPITIPLFWGWNMPSFLKIFGDFSLLFILIGQLIYWYLLACIIYPKIKRLIAKPK